MNFGAVYSLGHSVNGKGYKYNQKWLNGADYPSTQTGDTITNAFSLPHTFGAGLTYVYDNRLTIGADLPINNGRMQNSIMRKAISATVQK